MKKTLAVLLMIVLAAALAGPAFAEETAEYRDALYSFRYPASWSCDTAPNGDIVLGPPDKNGGILTFALVSDLWSFAGDTVTDAPMIEDYISSYGGQNLALTGEYTLVESGELRGFRAIGSWRASGQDAVMLVLSGNRHLVGFVLVGSEALALEQEILDSVELVGEAPAESAEGFLRWESAEFALDYPANYSMLEQTSGVAFIGADNPNHIIMARAYPLETDYTDALAPAAATAALPKSAKVEADPVMTEIGGRNAAVISGEVSDGPMEFYAFGSGRTVLVLMFMGEEPVNLAESVIRSVEFK